MPIAIPTMPPKRLSVSASVTNCFTMSPAVAPTARRMPISRVRSVTETSMMFITPIPPTSSEMPAMLPSRSESVLLTSVAASIRSSWLWITKSGSVVSWRKSSSSLMSSLRRSSSTPSAVWISICVTRRSPLGVKRKRRRPATPLSGTKTWSFASLAPPCSSRTPTTTKANVIRPPAKERRTSCPTGSRPG